MTQTDFRNQVDNLMNILFGAGVASHATIIEQINYLVFLRSLSRKDDNAMILDPSAEKIFSGELRKYHWDNLLILNADELFNSLEEVFRKLPEITTNQTIKLLFRDAHVKVFDKPTLRRLVHEIEKMFSDLEKQATAGHTDIFGDMYEYLLSKLSQAGTLGSFRTPRHIIKFIVDVIDPKKSETILDPACGTAGFLVAALKHLEEEYSSDEFKKLDKYPMDLLTPQERDFVYKYTFTGFDSDFDMFKFGLMNLYLHKLEHPNMKRQNTLVDTAGDRTKWDVILANPPFAGALDIDSISEDLRMGTRSTEILFLRYIIDHLSSSGRAGVIVPEGVVFNSTNAHKKIRQMLVEDAGLWCVVSLPSGIFNPYAGVKTSILFFDKSLKDKVKDILFVKVENDGLDLGATKRPIDKNDLPVILKIINKYKNGEITKNSLANYVERSKIIDNLDYNLSSDHYCAITDSTDTKWPMVELGKISDVTSGNSAPQDKKFFENGKHPFFRTSDVGMVHLSDNLKDVRDWLNDEGILGLKFFKKGTILFPKSGASTFLNHRAIMGFDGYVSSHLATITPKNKLADNKYIYSMLLRIDAKSLTSNQAYPSLRTSEIAKIKIPLPPLEIQKQLIEELDGYQKIIDGAKQIIKNWKPTIKVDSSWQKVKLGDVCSIKSKLVDPNNHEYFRLFHIGGANIESGNGNLINLKTVKEEKLISSKFLFDETVVLYNKIRPYLKKVVKPDFNGLCSADIYPLTPQQDKITRDFLFYLLLTPDFTNYAIQSSGRVGMPKVNRESLFQYEFNLPPINIQESITNSIEKERITVDSLRALIKNFEYQIAVKIEEVWGE